ncbi:RHS repeat-associated core domain-containing protein [Spirosoma arboris]|nr:RHS repeat-associated core domain-containing protein [Spirosoma arboris]
MIRLLFFLLLILTGSSGQFLSAQNRIRPTVPVPNGFEINSYTGNLYHRRTDLNIPGQGLPIDITFSYNATRRSRNWGMGKGWTFTYNMAYYTDNASIWIERADGRRDFYQKSGSAYVSPTGIYDALKEYEAGKFYVQTKDGLRYYFENATHKRLTRLQDANGNQISLTYTDTLLTKLTHSSGHILNFSWTSGRLTEIKDNTCSPERKIAYQYDSYGNPSQVTNPIGDFVKYYADSTARLVGYTDEGGNNMSIFYNRNGAVSKVVSCATSHTFSYVPRQLKTFVAEQVNGQTVVTTYAFDDKGRVTSKHGNCCGFNLEYSYDTNNNASRLTDGNKKSTVYTYDSNGNVLKEIDPAGNITTYTYEPAFNKVTSLTDKSGNATTFKYDARGNLIEIDKPLGVTEKSTYDTKGNRLSYTNPTNFTTVYAYDSNGNLTRLTDPEGGIRTYTYDCYGNQLTETDPENHTTTYQYNALNQRIKMTDALGQVTTYTYNKLRLLASETNALGKTTSYTYDGLGRRIKTTLPLGNATSTEYDEQGNVTKEIDGKGNSTIYTYNSRKQPLSITDALGNTIYYEYDDAGNKVSETDKNGNTTRFTYDDLYRLVKVTDALGGATTYSYNAIGNRTAEIDANGNTTAYSYDALQRLTKSTDALNYSEQYTYDAIGNRLTVKDKNGNVTTTTYDKLNRRKTISNALGGVTSFTYNSTGRIIVEKDPLNRTTSYAYDALSRLVKITNALNEATAYTYDAIGNEKTITYPNGKAETNTYDDNSQLLTTTDQIGTVIVYTYDSNGNIITEKDGNGNTTSFQFDALNQLIKTTYPNQTTTQIAYDTNGNKIKETDQKGNVTLFTYDKLNRTTSITDPLGHNNRFAYDTQGNLINVIDGKGNTTSYTYDNRTKLTLQTYADGSTKRFAYDAQGSLAEKTTGIGTKIQYKYDALNRLIERQYPGNVTETLDYDAAGYLVKATNTNATITLSYDAAGRLLREDNNGKATTYAYNTSGKTKSIDYPGGTKIVWQLDNRERLIEVRRNSTLLAGLQYDGADRLTKKTFSNGTTANYGYDAMSNLLSLTATPATQLNIRYQYDPSDQRILTERLHKPTRSEKYGYDATFQLKDFATGQYSNNQLTPSISYQYAYDALGNRTMAKEGSTEKTYTANYVNQYTGIKTNGSNAPPTYDKNGNLVSDGSNTYEYDPENRLLSIQNGTTKVAYTYDALGRRVSRTLGGTTTRYYYDLDNVIEENTNGIIKSLIYGSEIDQILYVNVGSNDYYYQTDDLNSVQAITGASGNLLEYYTYDPFGAPHIFNAADVELTISTLNNLLYTGRPYEFTFKTYNYRNRELNPTLGRFAQRDPFEYVDGLNNYSYVNNNVTNAIDPLGLVNWSGVGSAVGGIVWSGIGAATGVGLSSTGLGAIVGVPLAGVSGYELGANLGNLWDALNDQEATSTGSLAKDIVNAVDPCNGNYQKAAEAFDVLKDFASLGGGLFRGGVKLAERTFERKLAQEATEEVEKKLVNEGVYEFTAASGKKYVGQSSDIAKRLEQHLASGKLLPGTPVKTTEVLGGKTAREVAEQLRIDSLGGVRNLENIRNPIGPKRQHLLPKVSR